MTSHATTVTGYAGIGRPAGSPRPPITNRIRERRKELHLTQRQVGERAGIAPWKVYQYESYAEGCHVWTALKLARALETTVEALFELPKGWEQ